MLVVKVEIWPGGNEAAAREIGRMEMANISDLAAVSDYSVQIVQAATPRLGVPAFNEQVTVEGHARRDGPWRLVKRALDRLLPIQ